jgi:hypothetical protein
MSQRTETTTTRADGTLSEKQELLLSRFHDGECSCVSAFFARRLISRSPAAQSFVSDLQSLTSQCSTLVAQPTNVDLWSRIETRIEQEQRAEFYAGALRPQATQDSLFQDSLFQNSLFQNSLLRNSLLRRINLRHATFGGLSGAAIAAAVLVVVSRPQQIVSFSAPAAGPVANSQLIQQAGITNSGSQRPLYQTHPIKQHHSLEVDWMRANGSLKLIPDPNGSSAIIWVRPRSLPSTSRKSLPQIKPTPLGLALGGARSAVSERSQTQRYHSGESSMQSAK